MCIYQPVKYKQPLTHTKRNDHKWLQKVCYITLWQPWKRSHFWVKCVKIKIKLRTYVYSLTDGINNSIRAVSNMKFRYRRKNILIWCYAIFTSVNKSLHELYNIYMFKNLYNLELFIQLPFSYPRILVNYNCFRRTPGTGTTPFEF